MIAEFGWTVFQALFSAAVVTTLVAVLFQKRTEEIKFTFQSRSDEIKSELQRQLALFMSSRAWEEKSVSELLGPMWIQLHRTKRAFDRWQEQDLFLEAKIVREGNLVVRDLLLSKCHLIPPALRGDAAALVEHYDRWLEEYEKVRMATKPDNETKFVFVGVGAHPIPFPSQAEKNFKAEFEKMWKLLYGQVKSRGQEQSDIVHECPAKANQ